MDYAAEWDSEREVLESILTPQELEASDEDFVITVYPSDGSTKVKIALRIAKTPQYPEEAPEIELDQLEGSLDADDLASLRTSMLHEAEINLGMAMSYTLSSTLSEALASLIAARTKAADDADDLRQRQEEEAEAARTRGTPVTPGSFQAWHVKFLSERKRAKAKEDAEIFKALSLKEKEERKKAETRLTGREIFEKGLNITEPLEDDESATVDFTQYSKEDRFAQEEEDVDKGVLSDSD